MRALLALTLLLASPVFASTLNKCIDEKTGQVTYTNLKCGKSEALQKIELDPPPSEPRPRAAAAPPPAASAPAAALSAPAVVPPPAPAQAAAIASPEADARAPKRPPAPPPVCDTLSQQLGHLLDRMDAQRNASDPAQLQTLQRQVDELETKKRAAGCF